LAYPRGQGATARISQYAKGLTKLGVQVTVLCLKPTSPAIDSPSYNPASGYHEGIEFHYTSGSSVYSTNRLTRYLQNIYGIAGLLKYFLSRRLSGTSPQIVLMYGTDSPLYASILWICSRIACAKLIGENTEAPLVYSRASLFTLTIHKLNEKLTYKLFDGFVVISTYLHTYYATRLRKKAPLILLPVLVDVEEFQASPRHEIDLPPKLLYCGNLYNHSELETVLNIWAQAYAQLKQGKLVVIGDNSDQARMKRISDLLHKLRIHDTVLFTGLLPRSELPKHLTQASANILPRQSGTFSTAGLPNKLGEYLASGRPTITSSVGDIPRYLTHRESALLIEPTDIAGFANAVVELFTDKEFASNIGNTGRQVAKAHFDRDKCVERLQTLFRRTLSPNGADERRQ